MLEKYRSTSGETEIIEQKSTILLQKARETAISRLDKSIHGSQERLTNALENDFKPFLEENITLADQISSEVYVKFSKEVEDFLGTATGFIICVDGRLGFLAFGVPKAEEFTRRPSGMPLTRQSTETEEPVLNDPDLAAAISNKVKERKKAGKKPALNEFICYHIHSKNPKHGCSAEIDLMSDQGFSMEVGLRYGRIKEWFDRLGKNFESFNINARRAGGEGTTFDIVHDAYTDGLIFGLRNVSDEFDKTQDMTLEEKLLQLAKDGKILMTELLDEPFGPAIYKEAAELGKVRLDLNDPNRFAENVMTIGKIAMKLTTEAEKGGFEFIPKAVKEGKPDYAIRVLAFTAIFNTVYRILGRIEKGKNENEDHQEKLVIAGSIGTFNTENTALQHITSAGEFHHEDIETASFLHKLKGKNDSELAEKGKGLPTTQKGRIIAVSARFNPSIYANDDIRSNELEKIKSGLRNNAAKVRESKLKPSVKNGECIVFGVVIDERSREIIDIA